MTWRSTILAGALALTAAPALAEDRTPDQVQQAAQQRQTQPAPDPAVLAGAEMLQQAQGREWQALARAYRAEAQAKAEHDRAEAEKKRADDAEAKLPKPDAPK